MSYYGDVPFNSAFTVNLNNEVHVSAAFDLLAGAYIQTTSWKDLPNTADGIITHPTIPYLWRTSWGFGVRGEMIIEYSWDETETITEDMLHVHTDVLQTAHENTGTTFQYINVDFEERFVSAKLVVPPNSSLDWHQSAYPYGLGASQAKVIFDGGQHYICAFVLAENWQDWSLGSKDIEANGTLSIPREPDASSVYLVFSEDVTTDSGVVLNQGVSYAQTSSVQVTAGSKNTFVVRASF